LIILIDASLFPFTLYKTITSQIPFLHRNVRSTAEDFGLFSFLRGFANAANYFIKLFTLFSLICKVNAV